ncbi:MAG: 3'(2'),5'-bisphosphate nucleotidase CysQ [Bacteroidales bacterium]|nr:3'(2'),5'-bisphosphate nucleotidase CysQ [Bacteroidales bacterium]
MEEILLFIAIKAAIAAGDEIMLHYNKPFDVDYKSDHSPLTIADRSAHHVIAEALKPTGIPLLSEEGKHNPFKERKMWKLLWIVDPLDGTKEFIKHNDEFTVNIALVKENRPVLGVVYCPPMRTLYFGSEHLSKAYKAVVKENTINPDEILHHAEPLPIIKKKKMLTVVASKSHLNQETSDYINQLTEKFGEISLTSIGSSLKFCLIAEGAADIYPRFAPTYEWDTAAAQAILEISGGEVVNKDTNAPLIYNKENLLNPGFIARKKII